MSVNTQTAAQWQVSIDQLDQQIGQLTAQQRQLQEARFQNGRQIIALRQQRQNFPRDSAEYLANEQQINQLGVQDRSYQAEINELSQNIIALDSQLQAAERARDGALTAAPNTQANAPPPENSAPPLAATTPPTVQAANVGTEPAATAAADTGPAIVRTTVQAEDPALVQGPLNAAIAASVAGPEPIPTRTIDPALGEGPTTLVVGPTTTPAPVNIDSLPGGQDALFGAAPTTAPGAVDPAFAEELASAARAEEAERQRFLTTNLPVPPDVADQREEDDFDRNPEVEEPGEIGDEDPEVAGLLEQQRALAQADIGQAYSEPEPVPVSADPAYGGATQDEASALNAALAQARTNAPSAQGALDAGQQRNLREQFTNQQRVNASSQGDWRVRIRLAPGAQYLYKGENPGILKPLVASDGVIFPYTPTVQTQYQAKYDSYQLTHSNYRGYFYQGSQVGDITITGMFTAQDTAEAEYLLAVIHFFRTVTKMFYGQGQFRGSPPPLVQLSGFGEMQFNNHNCLVSTFNYSLPKDVDYIQIKPNNQGLNLSARENKVSSSPLSTIISVIDRLKNAGLPKGANPNVQGDLGVVTTQVNGIGQTTYVPTKIELSVVLHPLQTRQQVSQQFSLQNFANGNLLKGGFW